MGSILTMILSLLLTLIPILLLTLTLSLTLTLTLTLTLILTLTLPPRLRGTGPPRRAACHLDHTVARLQGWRGYRGGEATGVAARPSQVIAGQSKGSRASGTLRPASGLPPALRTSVPHRSAAEIILQKGDRTWKKDHTTENRRETVTDFVSPRSHCHSPTCSFTSDRQIPRSRRPGGRPCPQSSEFRVYSSLPTATD